MGPRTYKVSDLHFSIRCETYNSYLHTNPPPQVLFHQFIMPPPPEALTCLYHCCCFLCNGINTSCRSSYPSTNQGFDTIVGLRREPLHQFIVLWASRGSWWEETGGPPTFRPEQSYKWERRHTLTQDLKAMGPLTYKVFDLHFSIRCETYNSYLHTTPPIKCRSINSLCFPLKNRSSYLLLPPQTEALTCLDRRCCFLCNRTDTRSRSSYPSSN